MAVIFAMQKIDAAVKSKVDGCARGNGAVSLLLDPGGQTAKRYNARWSRRAYALDERGRVTYVQAETALDPEGPSQVADLLHGAAKRARSQ